jgi:hypothetical protein
MKKVGQPMVSASTPASGPTHTRPTEAKADSSANCVAVKRWLHRLISKATKAAVPMPPDRFSSTTTSSRPPSTGVGWASLTKPQSKAGSTSPAPISPRPPSASHQKPRLLAICSTPKSSSARHSPSLIISSAAQQRAADGQPQADDLVDHAHLGRRKAHALEQEGREQRARKGIAQLVEHDQHQHGRRAAVAEVVAQTRPAGCRSAPAARPRPPAAA